MFGSALKRLGRSGGSDGTTTGSHVVGTIACDTGYCSVKMAGMELLYEMTLLTIDIAVDAAFGRWECLSDGPHLATRSDVT